MERYASCSFSPAFTAIPAHMGRDWIRETGWSVVTAVITPESFNIPTVLNAIFWTSILLRLARSGPTMAGNPSAASSSAIRCPSEQWSKVTFKSNSLAIRMAVKMSSTLCTWAFKGISRRNTGAQHSFVKSS